MVFPLAAAVPPEDSDSPQAARDSSVAAAMEANTGRDFLSTYHSLRTGPETGRRIAHRVIRDNASRELCPR
ncbi:hypothetical protein GCM10009727_43060 [Actinomadura napierensis]|uniref:Uncharacterized protein n=1 Tax=Actinomadura napierensis TaxID=267854 RepID=A0ABN2ZKS4_9ACTN